MPEKDLEQEFYEDMQDVTFFLPPRQLGGIGSELTKKQIDATVTLRSPTTRSEVTGRLNASSCFNGEWMSCTFRATSHIPPNVTPYHTAYDPASSRFNPQPRQPVPPSTTQDTSGFSERYLNSIEQLCDVLFKRIFPVEQKAQGLIVISGSTAAGKSQIARGLIYKYLLPLIPNQASKTRRPHLVTFEDPIDKLWADSPEGAKSTGIDYTPRELSKDVDSLDKCISAALRQTPAVLFVGETRDPEHWKSLLRFASTGHLVITTSHAGSLTEAMGELLRSAGADNPARRSEVANRVMAVVHLRSKKISLAADCRLQFTIPAIWVRAAVSMKSLMADGLAAILPYRDARGWDEERGQAGELGCLGRSWFAEQLLGRLERPVDLAVDSEVRRAALVWDLEGV